MAVFETLDGGAPLVIGHRGASADRPEHTIKAYRLAIELGADVIEPDVVVTKDGHLIARHENDLSGTTDVSERPEFAGRRTTKVIDGEPVTGWFAEDFTLAEIKTLFARERIPGVRPDNTAFDDQYRVPTLAEVVELVKRVEAETGRKIGVIPETKHPTFFLNEGKYLDGTPINQDTSRTLIDTLTKAGFALPERVAIQSFELANLIALQSEIMPGAGVDIPLVQLLGGSYDLAFNLDPAKAALGADPSIYDRLGLPLTTASAANEDLYTPAALRAMKAAYAEAIGPFKDSIRPTEPLATPVDGDGDGRAQIASRLTGETTSLVRDAHAAGLEVVPYTLRIEEPFRHLKPDGTVETPWEEVRAYVDIGVDGFFTDSPDLGRQVVDQAIAGKAGGLPAGTGPASSASPYLVPSAAGVSFASVITSGDAVAGAAKADGTPWRFVGIPDGIGAFDNGDGTVTVLVNHEIGATNGAVRAHGSVGAFVSELVVDKNTLAVRSAGDLARTVFQDSDGDGAWTQATTAWARFCSGDLAGGGAFYDAATGLGTLARIYLAGEEAGPEGRAFAFLASGPNKGQAYELPRLGNMSFENAVANERTGARTVVVALDDATPGQVYVYAGDKQATGNEVERAGLANGTLYGIKAAGITDEAAAAGAVPLSGRFTVEAIPGAATRTGAQIDADSKALGVTDWWRPEDGAWDTQDPNRFYFVTTASATGPSRLWALDFADARDPTRGGTFTALLDGTEGQVMLDNLTVAADGTLVIQEDPGNNPRLSKVWSYDPKTDALRELAQHDPARFGAPTPPFTQDEESSGVIDVTRLFPHAEGEAVYLLDTQAHYSFGAEGSADRTEIVEGGQLMLMRVASGGAGSDATPGAIDWNALAGEVQASPTATGHWWSAADAPQGASDWSAVAA